MSIIAATKIMSAMQVMSAMKVLGAMSAMRTMSARISACSRDTGAAPASTSPTARSRRVPLVLSALLITSALIPFGGCAATQRQNTMLALQESIDGYNHALRWQNFEAAAAYLPNDLRTTFLALQTENASNLQIESFTIMKVELESERSARVQVLLSYMLLPSVTLQSRRVVQHWHRVQDDWILETEDDAIFPLEEEFGAGSVSPSPSGSSASGSSPSTSLPATPAPSPAP
ncbi:MAG: hypothetical protein IPK13_04010 [Deltaproteobacteria bacterium]|nr:hypothetical protein [Deltaproteobacteria bacterium]